MTTTPTLTLATFLLDRIAEDQAAALEVMHGASWSIDPRDFEQIVDEMGECVADSVLGSARHIARHDPARVLAECEAKRAQIERAQIEQLIPRMECDCAIWNEYQLEIMAAVYSDHPDYREEWRP